MISRRPIAALLLSVCPAAFAQEVSVEVRSAARGEADAAFSVGDVPAPAADDAGNRAAVRVVAGAVDPNGGGVAALTDGKLPTGEDRPAANFFLAGSRPGRALFDLGRAVDLKAIRTYSWHPTTRADQAYDVWVPAGPIEPDDADTAAKAADLAAGWTRLASVDTAAAGGEKAQVAVALTRPDGAALANTRFVLLAVRPNGDGPFRQTFYSEIDFDDGTAHPPPAATERAVDVLEIAGGYTIRFDTTEVPALRPWVRETLMPACREWYPRIVEALPSDGFEPPADFRVTFRADMRGVAHTRGTDVVCAGPWYRANLGDEAVGSVIHELVHVVQQYRLPRDRQPPAWLSEGIADHVRWYQFEPETRRRRVDWDRMRYDGSYFPSATFLDLVVRRLDEDAIRKVNAVCRAGNYADDYWTKTYGKTPQEIWELGRTPDS